MTNNSYDSKTWLFLFQSDVARVNITIMNVNDNDPTFAQSQYNFLVKQEDVRIGSLIGTIEVSYFI